MPARVEHKLAPLVMLTVLAPCRVMDCTLLSFRSPRRPSLASPGPSRCVLPDNTLAHATTILPTNLLLAHAALPAKQP